jgi:hypothetical protein
VSAPPPTDLYAPRLVHVDVADGYCRLVIPQIPQRVNPPAPASSPPRQQATLDIFGEGGPGDGGMLSAAPPGGRHRAGMASMLLALTLVAGTAYAGTDATFTTALTKFTGFLQGSGGKIITVLSLAAGLISLASGRFTLGQIAVPVGVGVGVGTGVPIVTSVITAVI